MAHLRNERITGVLNLMTNTQMEQRSIDWQRHLADFRSNGINNVIHCPVDLNSQKNNEMVFEASQILNDLIYHKDCNVYVQCQAGFTTSPTCVLAYLSLFKRVHKWESLSHTSQLVSQCIANCQHNEPLVEKVVDDNLEFLARQYDRETEEAMKLRDGWRQEDENKRIQDQQEWDRLRLEATDRANQRAQREQAARRETD